MKNKERERMRGGERGGETKRERQREMERGKIEREGENYRSACLGLVFIQTEKSGSLAESFQLVVSMTPLFPQNNSRINLLIYLTDV